MPECCSKCGYHLEAEVMLRTQVGELGRERDEACRERDAALAHNHDDGSPEIIARLRVALRAVVDVEVFRDIMYEVYS